MLGSGGRQVGDGEGSEGVEDKWETGKGLKGCERAGRGPEGPEEVGKTVGECRRDGKAWEGNTMLQKCKTGGFNLITAYNR